MIIKLKNKDKLIVDDFILKCCIGKSGINNNKKEGDKSTPSGVFQLGNILMMEKNYSEAIKLFDRSVKIKPDFWQAINNKGLAYFEENKINLSIKHFEKAISIEENAEPLLGLASCLRLKDMKEFLVMMMIFILHLQMQLIEEIKGNLKSLLNILLEHIKRKNIFVKNNAKVMMEKAVVAWIWVISA